MVNDVKKHLTVGRLERDDARKPARRGTFPSRLPPIGKIASVGRVLLLRWTGTYNGD